MAPAPRKSSNIAAGFGCDCSTTSASSSSTASFWRLSATCGPVCGRRPIGSEDNGEWASRRVGGWARRPILANRSLAYAPTMLDGAALDEEYDFFGHVRRQVCNALDIARHQKKVHSGGNLSRIFHHVREQDAEVVLVEIVDAIITIDDLSRQLAVALHERV